jgi:hypothetical protein
MGRRGMMALVVVSALAFPGCIDDFLGILDVVDLRASDDPGERAAGDAAEAQDKDRRAQRKATQGVREGSIEKLDEAAELRPRDARYKMYKAAVQIATREGDARDALSEGRGIIEANNPDADKKEIERMTTEALLEGIDLVLDVERKQTPPDSGAIEQLERVYCGLLDHYTQEFGSSSRATTLLAHVAGAAVACG